MPKLSWIPLGWREKSKEFKRLGRPSTLKGNAAESVMYLQSGGVKLTVVNEVGKEAVVAVLGPGDFFGEGCLAGQPIRMGTATAVTPATVLVIEKTEMFKVLHEEHGLSDRFIKFMLARNIRIEARLGRSVIQFEREAACPHSSIACALRQRRPAPGSSPQDVARNAGGNDWHNTLARQFLHEQVQKAGLHQVQRRASDQYFSLERRAARVALQ